MRGVINNGGSSMAVISVHTFRVKAGRLQEFLKLCAEARKIHEGLGGRVRIWQPAFGGEAATVGYTIEHDDMTAHGTFSDKLQSDSAWQALTKGAQANTDPSVEPVSSALYQESPQ